MGEGSTARYKPYPVYKPSGVEWLGNIPKGWSTIQIGRLFKRVKRTGHVQKELLSVYRDHGVVPKSSRNDNNNNASDDLSPYQLVMQNDLVLNKMKTWQGSISISNYEGIVSPAYFVYQPNFKLFEAANPKYVHFLLRNPMYVAQYLRRSKGIRVNQWDLDPSEFQRIELLLPPLSEQTKIAAFLDYETGKIDGLLGKQERLIELLEEKRQAVISHAVTKGLDSNAPLRPSGIDWLGDVPAHWEVKKFSYCTSIRSGQVDPRKAPYDDYILIAPNHIQSKTGKLVALETAKEQAAESGKYLCEAGEVIYSKIRPALAKACLVPDNHTICSADMYPIAGKHGLSNKFLFWNILSDWFTALTILESDRVAMPKINREKLAEVSMPVPPLYEQSEICQSIEVRTTILDQLNLKAEAAINLLKERRTALISAAVTGKIDVRDWQPPKSISGQEPMSAKDAEL